MMEVDKDVADRSIKEAIKKAEQTASKVFNSALSFLFIGLLVATVGIIYFYFSNDALNLDRGFYEDRINNLEAINSNLSRDISLIAEAYDKRLGRDTIADKALDRELLVSQKTRKYYVDFYNSIVSLYQGADKDVVKKFNRVIDSNSAKIDALNAEASATKKPVAHIIKSNKELDDMINKYLFNRRNPVKYTKSASSVSPYDRPEFILSPRNVYGFLTRLSGLLFMELIAFYLLRQYRINMNDFRHYDGIANQLRANAYVMDKFELVKEEKNVVDLLGKLLVTNSSSSNSDLEAGSSVISADSEAVKKLLDLAKDLLKK
jgi:hypothetical protein